ncbi:MAG: hypothetical protein KDD64_04810 [Bdellovibrionales bacterium]|nr:hypothetical protein [Bdellovibrionales bacterium]
MSKGGDDTVAWTKPLKGIRAVLRPIVRLCLRRATTIQDFVRVAKAVFLEVAEEELRLRGDKVNISRLSVLTGIDRKEIMRLNSEGQPELEEPGSLYGRVMAMWRHSRRFQTKSGAPRVLTLEGDDSEFRELVRLVSASISPGTVLYELEKLGQVQRTKNGLKLLRDAAPLATDHYKGDLLLGSEIETLSDTIEENVKRDTAVGHHQLRTEYDNILQRELPQIRMWFLEEGKLFHRRVREFLSKFDLDVSPRKNEEKAGAKVVFSSFSWTTEAEEPEDEIL